MADVKITGLPAATVPLSGTELFEVVQTGSSAKVAATAIANTADNVRTVPTGGTGVATLTAGQYLKGNGTSAITSSATIPTTDLTGTIGVANGGTGATTLSSGQYLKGNGTSAITSSATIPYNDLTGRAYISAYGAVTQTGSTSSGTAAIIGTTVASSGISIANNGSGFATRITFTDAGTYAIMPSMQFANSSGADVLCTVWFKRQGSDIAYSSTVVSVPKSTDGGKTFFQIVFYEQVTAGQYIEVYWLPASTSVTMEYIAATATAPAAPAIILSAERIA